MKTTVALFAVLLACGPSKEEIEKAHSRNRMRAMDGIGCNDTTAYYAAYYELRGALKHPDASDLDSLHEVKFSHRGDTISLSLDALASNAFGVKDRVYLFADFYCQNDSLYWLKAFGTDGLYPDIERGKPVEQKASLAWVKDRSERRQKAHDAEMDSLRRLFGVRLDTIIPLIE